MQESPDIFLRNFSAPEVTDIFNSSSRFQRWMNIEAALAQAQAELGLIPASAAKDIIRTANINLLNLETIILETERTGHSLVPLLRAWEDACPAESAQYLHHGATTQDIQDTSLSIECREVSILVERKLIALSLQLHILASKYKSTTMVGRTHARAALPTTFGLVFATWLDACCHNLSRLRVNRESISTAQLFGGVGTMAAFGGKGDQLLNRFSQELKLNAPTVSWHCNRERIVEFISILGLISGTLARIANEIFQLSKDEISELQEPFNEHNVSSSTMPHKCNPERSEQVVTLFHLVKSNVSLAYETLISEHQRDYRTLRLEWAILPNTAHSTVAALDLLKTILAGLHIKEEQAATNLQKVNLEVCSEALMFNLAELIGKPQAYEVVRRAYSLKITSKTDLVNEILKLQPQLPPETRNRLLASLNPHSGTGEAARLVDQVLAESNQVFNISKGCVINNADH